MSGTMITENDLETLTENSDKAFATTGDLSLDFFTRITRNAAVEDYIDCFVKAWNEDRRTIVKILFNLRDIRGGKGEKLIPAAIMVYLKYKIPNPTYEAILRCMVEHGCWKDLLRIYEIECRTIVALSKSRSNGTRRTTSEYFPELLFIADQLKADLLALTDNEKAGISLCAKWAPSEKTHYDKHPMFAVTKIRNLMKLKPKEYRIMLTKLRAHLNLLETLMSTQRYDEIDFSKLPSVAHMKMKEAFQRDTNSDGVESESRKKLHESYSEYLAKLKKGEVKVNVKGIQPHELVSNYLGSSGILLDVEIDDLAEAQWEALKQRTLESGAFRDVTAIVDTSGSMNGQPLQVAISLGILVAECTKGPFHGQVITFSSNPRWHRLTGSNLKEKVHSMKYNDWGQSTNLRAVFDMILKNACDAELAASEMVKTLFIFTDMQFNQCDNGKNWESTFEYAKRCYEEAGYELPRIICWNLRTSASKTLPCEQNEKGFAMLSGFSAELLKCVLTAQDITPYGMMLHVLEPYDVPQEVSDCTITTIDIDTKFIGYLKTGVESSAIKKAFKKPGGDDKANKSSSDEEPAFAETTNEGW